MPQFLVIYTKTVDYEAVIEATFADEAVRLARVEPERYFDFDHPIQVDVLDVAAVVMRQEEGDLWEEII